MVKVKTKADQNEIRQFLLFNLSQNKIYQKFNWLLICSLENKTFQQNLQILRKIWPFYQDIQVENMTQQMITKHFGKINNHQQCSMSEYNDESNELLKMTVRKLTKRLF